MIPVLFLAVLACGVCLPGGSVQADDKPVRLDPKSGSILGVSLGMGEKKVRRALKNAGVAKVERVDYPRYFVLQAPELHPSIQGGLAFYFEDGNGISEHAPSQSSQPTAGDTEFVRRVRCRWYTAVPEAATIGRSDWGSSGRAQLSRVRANFWRGHWVATGCAICNC